MRCVVYIHSFPTTSRTQELVPEAALEGGHGVLVLISEAWGAALAGGDASHVGELAQANVIK